MNGPSHYAAAEQLIDDARLVLEEESDIERAGLLMAEAQVRATLALAAATAAPMMGTEPRGNWNETGR